jgi:hypothetical protein
MVLKIEEEVAGKDPAQQHEDRKEMAADEQKAILNWILITALAVFRLWSDMQAVRHFFFAGPSLLAMLWSVHF